MSRVALATCAAVPELQADDQLCLRALVERGLHAEPAVWDDPTVDWNAYDLVVVRNTWDYHQGRREEFLAWADSVPRLANPAPVLRWNTDKHYLADLNAHGVPTVPTTYFSQGQRVTLPDEGEYVVKPTVSAGARNMGRFTAGDPEQMRTARQLVERVFARGHDVIVQPYIGGIDTFGETSLIYLDGIFSHAVRREAVLTGDRRVTGDAETAAVFTTRTPLEEEYAAGHQVLSTLPHLFGADVPPVLYGRVDVVPGANGLPLVMEVELTEPDLFLGTRPASAGRFAEGIVAYLEQHGGRASVADKVPAPRAATTDRAVL